MDISEYLREELQDFIDGLSDAGASAAEVQLSQISLFTQAGIYNPSPDNLAEQSQNIAHAVNALASAAAIQESVVRDKVRIAIANVMASLGKGLVAALT